jgi:hypothetical protein
MKTTIILRKYVTVLVVVFLMMGLTTGNQTVREAGDGAYKRINSGCHAGK